MSREIGTMEQRATKKAKEQQREAEENASNAIIRALKDAFPKGAPPEGWRAVESIRAFLYPQMKGLTEEEIGNLGKMRAGSIAHREDLLRNELTEALQQVAWALENYSAS